MTSQDECQRERRQLDKRLEVARAVIIAITYGDVPSSITREALADLHGLIHTLGEMIAEKMQEGKDE